MMDLPLGNAGRVKNKKAGTSPRAGLVFTWQRNRRAASIRFRNNPKLDAVSVVINRKEPQVFIEGKVVFRPIVLSAVSPIAARVPHERGNAVFRMHLF